jgi:dihydrofolate reductase/predicted enzyme related to lactoylglutathione lyase
MSQPVVHFEIVGGNAAALHAYYAQLFGWRIEPGGPGGYGVVRLGGPGRITGGIGSGEGERRYVTVYVEVPDVGAALDRAEELGGRRLSGPDTVPGSRLELGRFTDPEGHVIGLTRHVPGDTDHRPATGIAPAQEEHLEDWMRKLILGFYVSLDGKSADFDNGIRDVMMSIDDPEQEEYFVEQLWDAGAFLMGRTSYEMMAPYWPTSDHPSAKAMNEIPKVVFSRTLKSADEWPETRIASGDTADEIAELKAEPGKDLVAAGGTAFNQSLIKLGVVDEYRLWVLPAITGKGAALVPELDEAVKLRLVKSTAFPSGILELRYVPADK